MAKTLDLELLREIFKDQRQHIAVGKITRLGLAPDRSTLRVMVSILPEERELVATMTWDDVGDNAGIYCFPEKDDLVLVAFSEGSQDEAFVVRRMSSKEERIPVRATEGHLVAQAKEGKKVFVASDSRVVLGLPDSEGDEPIVLGNVLKSFLEALITALTTDPLGTCAVGPVSLSPAIKVLLEQHKATYLTTASSNILSQLSFTERGGE